MRIAIVSRGWWPSIKGGSERFISRIAEELHKKGHEVTAVTRRIRGFPGPEAPHGLVISEEGRPIPLVSSLRFSMWAAKVVNGLDVDVALVNSYWGEMAPIFIKKPCIAIIHDIGLFSSTVSGNRWKNRLRAIVLRNVAKKAKIIVVPTEGVKRDLIKRLGVEEGKIRVLGFEGVDGPFRRVHVEDEWFDIVQVARFAPNKGQHVLLKAFEAVATKIPRSRLWLVGGRSPGHLSYLNEVLERATSLRRALGEDRVKVVIDAPSVDEYYSVADVCAAPSIAEEGFGLTVLECAAHGKPVIASDIFAETGVASHDATVVVPRNDAEALARAIVRVYEDRELAERISSRALERVRSYRWDKVAEAVERAMYEALAGRA